MARALGVEKGGRVSSSLDQLEEAGFVSSDPGLNPFTGESVQQKRYRLSDNYARFYLRYIELVYDGRLHPSIEADGAFDFLVNVRDFLA